jgi:hypothetical protein
VALTIPTTVRGALTASTAYSIVGESFLASPTAATRQASSNPKLMPARQVVGRRACIGGASISTVERYA